MTVVPFSPLAPGVGLTPGVNSSSGPAILVRERPPLRISYSVATPSGRRYRWAADEPHAENVPSGARCSSTAPGGYESFDVKLPRQPGIDYGDLQRLSTITARDAGGSPIWQGRLERAPAVSGDQMAVTPSAVGWQAALSDDRSARVIYRDASLSGWGDMARNRRLYLIGASYHVDGSVSVASDGTLPAVDLAMSRVVATPSAPQRIEAWYGRRVPIGSVYYDYSPTNMGAGWKAQMLLSDDDAGTTVTVGTNHGATPSTATVTATGTRAYAAWIMEFAGTFTGDGDWHQMLRRVAVYGNHGLTKRRSEPDAGFYASDIVTHSVETWAPKLVVSSDTVQQSSFVIPHMMFTDPTTAGDIVREATRYGLQDWFVWDGPTFWWHERGLHARNWRARVGPTQLEETGPQVDRIWNSIIVQFQDVDGSTRTVGPPGSGMDVESTYLRDDDPQNPATLAGITRRDVLQMGTATSGSAIEIGRRFLEESKVLDSSGRARIVGYVEDDRGVTSPYHHVRAGDTITFVDAASTVPRRIVRAEHDFDALTCAVDLDAPPDALDALLARLDVTLRGI